MNRVTIEPTKFVNVRTGHATFGVRVYDDEGQSYDNTWDSIPEDDLEVLKLVLASDNQTISAMMDFVQEHERGITIGGTEYSWGKIKHLFS